MEQNWHFWWQWRKKLHALPPFGGTFGGNGGPGKIISPVAGSVGSRDSPLSARSPVRTTCTVFLVFAMFAMTTMAESRTLTPYPRLQALRFPFPLFSVILLQLIIKRRAAPAARSTGRRCNSVKKKKKN